MLCAYFSKSALNRLGKITISISLAAALAACSSASERFGPYQGKQVTRDPGHQQLPNLAENRQNTITGNSEYTASINRGASDVNVTTRELAPIGAPPKTGQIVVKQGDTLYSLARNNGTTVDQLVSSNNLQAPYVIKPGQVLNVAGKSLVPAQRIVSPQASRITYKKSGRYSRHEVLSGENVGSIANLYGLRKETVGHFNDLQPPFNVKTGQVLKIPYSDAAVQMIKPVAVQPKAKSTLSMVPIPIPVSNPLRGRSISTSKSDIVPLPVPKPTYVASIKSPKTVVAPVKKAPVKLVAPQPRTSSKFRWPVKGRIISHFGTKPNGVRNDGINVAVPLGTSVKAAENGVVTYAGNELQGYGNLVIVSHADNWVTLYAHNSQIMVKKGQIVKRGQIISKAGKTGQVSTPQVHFEIRRGAKVVNPVKYMAPAQFAGIR